MPACLALSILRLPVLPAGRVLGISVHGSRSDQGCWRGLRPHKGGDGSRRDGNPWSESAHCATAAAGRRRRIRLFGPGLRFQLLVLLAGPRLLLFVVLIAPTGFFILLPLDFLAGRIVLLPAQGLLLLVVFLVLASALGFLAVLLFLVFALPLRRLPPILFVPLLTLGFLAALLLLEAPLLVCRLPLSLLLLAAALFFLTPLGFFLLAAALLFLTPLGFLLLLHLPLPVVIIRPSNGSSSAAGHDDGND